MPSEKRGREGCMVAVEDGRSKKSTPEKQVGAAFLCVITDECHSTCGNRKQGPDGLDQCVELSAAEPGGPVDERSNKKKTQGQNAVGERSPHDSIRAKACHWVYYRLDERRH